MKALIQRVSRGSVTVNGQTIGRVGRGFVVLLGVRTGDRETEAQHLARRTADLRVFQDSAGKMNLSVRDIDGEILVVSQFTLYADTRRGNRPSFIDAAAPDAAEMLYGLYVEALRRILGEHRVATGVFRASMSVEMVNDGPVTVELCAEAGA